MSSIIGQISYPVFLYCVWIFFILASIFSFIVGVGLVLQSPAMLRFYKFMSKKHSIRSVIQPLIEPHFIEPVLFKRRILLGVGIIAGGAASILILNRVDADIFQPVFLGTFTAEAASILADYTKSFLMIGNAVVILVGVLVLFFPQLLTDIEAYTDKWYSLRKQLRPLTRVHFDVDQWVLAHATFCGVTLSVMSLGMGVSMYARI